MKKRENDFGLPKIDYTPMGTIEMAGRFNRGMEENKKGRSLWVRVCVIFFSVIVFVIPGLFSLGLIIFNYNNLDYDGGVLNIILGIFFGALSILVGAKIIVSNVKNRYDKKYGQKSARTT
jgi:hypothetical protein